MNFKKYKYNMIVIQIDNKTDSIYIQKYLFSKGLLWYGDNRNISSFNFNNDRVLYLYVTLNDNINLRGDGHKHYFLQSNVIDTSHISKFNTDPKIYTINDLSKIKSIIEYGEISPSYKPKRIERSL
jgi:hypothetical protein